VKRLALRENNCATMEIQSSARLEQEKHTIQDAQKVQTSHPPNPGAPRRALSQARPQREAFRFLIPLLWGVAKAALNCAHRTSTVSSCAFCEQGGHLAAPLLILLRPRVARAQRAVWLPCFPRACWAPPGFSSNKTLKSMRSNQAGSTTSWWKRAHASSFTPG
jgi:hypothetical protein